MAVPVNMTPFEAVTFYFDQACDRLGVRDEVRTLMCTPDREVRVEIPVRMDDGSLEVFIGYRIQHNGARGPYKGGTRYHPLADQEEIRALALEMDDRLNGAWKPAEEDEELQSRYWSLFKSDEITRVETRIGAEFLRQNRALLE